MVQSMVLSSSTAQVYHHTIPTYTSTMVSDIQLPTREPWHTAGRLRYEAGIADEVRCGKGRCTAPSGHGRERISYSRYFRGLMSFRSPVDPPLDGADLVGRRAQIGSRSPNTGDGGVPKATGKCQPTDPGEEGG